jgi:RNA polymerase sigma factor (sigma-70 family)
MGNMPSSTDRKALFTQEQFERIHNTYNRRLFFWFRKRVNADVAEELAAKSLVKFWQSDYRGDCAVSTWIYKIAKSVLSDWRKSAKQRNQFLEDAMENRLVLERKYASQDESAPISWEEGAEAADPTPDPETQAMIREQLAGRFTDPRLDSLDAGTKEILIRYFIENDPVEEIAGDLGLSPSTVYKIILRICPNS